MDSLAKPKTLQYFIETAEANIGKPDSQAFQLALKDFQTFCRKVFEKESESFANSYQIDDIIASISKYSTTNPLLYVTFLNSVIDIPIPDKASQANRISRELINIAPSPDKNVWIGFEKIVKWVFIALKNSFTLILQPLRQTALEWIAGEEAEPRFAGFSLLTILISNFSSSMESFMNHSREVIIKSFKEAEPEVFEEAGRTLKVLLENGKSSHHSTVSSLMKSFNNRKSYQYIGAAYALSKILDSYPEDVKYVKFKGIPIDLLQSKDTQMRNSVYPVLPLIYRTTPDLFTDEILVNIFKTFEGYLKKKAIGRNEALVGVADFLFARGISVSDDERKYILKCRKEVIDLVDTPEASKALIALDMFSLDNLQNDIQKAFVSINKKMVWDALKKFIKLVPEKAKFIYSALLTLANSVLLSSASPPNQVVNMFELLMEIEVPTSFYSIPLINEYSIHLTSISKDVREKSMMFMLNYQKKSPSTEIALRIVSNIATELNKQLRVDALKEIEIPEIDVAIIRVLESLLHDLDKDVRIGAFSILVKFANIPPTSEIITNLLMEKLRNMQHSNQSDKEDIDTFNIAAKAAFKDTTKPYAATNRQTLVPFAQFLIKHLIDSTNRLSTASLQLLSFLLPLASQCVNLSLLAQHISNSLLVHSTKERLNNALDLMESALKYTNLRYTILTEERLLFAKFLLICNLPSTSVDRSKLTKIIGMIGAIDPLKVHEIIDTARPAEKVTNTNSPNIFISRSPSIDPFASLSFATVGVSLINILDILGDESLSTLHGLAIEALLTFLKSYRTLSDELENLLLVRINSLLQSSGSSTISTLLNNMPTLIASLGQRFEPLVQPVVDLLCKQWETTETVVITRICEWLHTTIPETFEKYMPKIALLFTKDFENQPFKVIDLILSCLVSFGTSITIVDQLVYPPILNWIADNAEETINCTQIISRFRSICVNGGADKFAIPIFNAMVRAKSINPDLEEPCIDVIFAAAYQIGQQFLLHKQYLSEKFDFSKNPDFQIYSECLEIGATIPTNVTRKVQAPKPKKRMQKSNKIHSMDLSMPKSAQELPVPSTTFSETNWISWYDELYRTVIRSSSSRAISVCITLAERHSPARESIFPLAFALMHVIQDKLYMESSLSILKVVFKSHTTPRYILKNFLSVIEILEVIGKKCPIQTDLLKTRAQDANNNAQALRAAERMFDEGIESAEDVIVLNQQLGLPLAANGILRCNAQRGALTAQGELAEKLGLWEDALTNFQEKVAADPTNSKFIAGKLNCLNNLSRYEELKAAIKESNNDDIVYKASAEWGLFNNEEFMNVIKNVNDSNIKHDSTALFYKLVYYAMNHQFEKVQTIANRIYRNESNMIYPMIYEDYERAYNDTSLVSLTKEVEEVVSYMKAKEHAEIPIPSQKKLINQELETLNRTWNNRFNLFPNDPSVLFKHLRVRSLVLGYEELRPQWLSFLDCAIKKNFTSLAKSTLNELISQAPEDPELMLAQARLKYHIGDKEDAYKSLNSIAESFQSISGVSYLQLGQWYHDDSMLTEAEEVVKKAVSKLSSNAEAWKLWSIINFELYELKHETSFIVSSFEGSLNGLALSQKDSLSFTLRILSILFRYGCNEVYDMFQARFPSIPAHVWINVLPQIIARSSSEDTKLKQIILELLSSVGLEHPNVALYSLMVPLKNEDSSRRKVAERIYEMLKLKYPETVDSILTLTDELIRVAVTWWEQWFTNIDEASRALIARNDVSEMLSLLTPMHDLISREPQTYFEVSFMSSFGQCLANAYTLIQRYQTSKDEEDLLQAWQIYYSVYQKLKPIINEMSAIQLKDASLVLSQINNLPLAVPGTYSYGEDIITITSIEKKLSVMKSKQRPRRMAINGSNGKKYTFLLKAHEDTRLDERVMQLFAYINTIVGHSTIPMKNHLDITTYQVIPLTGQVGLIGWVEDCNTLYDLVKQRREKLGTPLEIEYLSTLKFAPKFETLPLNDKVFAFKRGLSVTKGDDLKMLMLAHATDSAHWIERRTAYTTSLAMTSMAGYILGLGDRHLCNIMIKSKTAKLVHIDFGDCFEVAMHREKAPEKVPFRLTRILTNALEVSRIEGTFRSCCENVMELMRQNGEEINGILEVFVYDPLLQWIEATSNTESFSLNTPATNSAADIIGRIKDKLSGKDFPGEKLSVNEQVDRLIKEATDARNLCQMFRGWFPWW